MASIKPIISICIVIIEEFLIKNLWDIHWFTIHSLSSNHISFNILDDQLVSIRIPFCKDRNMQIRWFRSPPRSWFIYAKVDTYWNTYFATSDCSAPVAFLFHVRYFLSLSLGSVVAYLYNNRLRKDNIKCYASGTLLLFGPVSRCLPRNLPALTIALPLHPYSIYMHRSWSEALTIGEGGWLKLELTLWIGFNR